MLPYLSMRPSYKKKALSIVAALLTYNKVSATCTGYKMPLAYGTISDDETKGRCLVYDGSEYVYLFGDTKADAMANNDQSIALKYSETAGTIAWERTYEGVKEIRSCGLSSDGTKVLFTGKESFIMAIADSSDGSILGATGVKSGSSIDTTADFKGIGTNHLINDKFIGYYFRKDDMNCYYAWDINSTGSPINYTVHKCTNYLLAKKDKIATFMLDDTHFFTLQNLQDSPNKDAIGYIKHDGSSSWGIHYPVTVDTEAYGIYAETSGGALALASCSRAKDYGATDQTIVTWLKWGDETNLSFGALAEKY